MKGVRKVIDTKLTSKSTEFDVHRGFGDKLDSYVPATVGQNTEEVWIHFVKEELIKTHRQSPYFPQTVELDKYYCTTLFLDAALTPF